MQHRLEIGRLIEIARLAPEQKVRHKAGARSHFLGKLQILMWPDEKPPIQKRCNHHQNQCRKNAPEPAIVELKDTVSPCFHFRKQDSGNQVAGDHKEDIDPNIAAREQCRKRMKQNNDPDSDGSLAINIGTVFMFMVRFSAQLSSAA